MKFPKYELEEKELIELAKQFKVKQLYLFGSVLREDFNAQSDIDIMVVFDSDTEFSYFDLYDFKEKLQQLFNRRIDLIEKDGLINPFRRSEILSTARLIYAA
jgi:hypothetical protein